MAGHTLLNREVRGEEARGHVGTNASQSPRQFQAAALTRAPRPCAGTPAADRQTDRPITDKEHGGGGGGE